MKYAQFKEMAKEVDKHIKDSRGLLSAAITYDIVLDFVVFNYFWDYENDKPTCDIDQMSKVIMNTVKKKI